MRDALSLSASTAFTLGACFLLLKGVHEFGHAAAYRFFCEREALATGPIRAGICFFALAPFPFTNVTGAWRIRSRWRRAGIGLAGIYFETWAAAFALIAWASLAPGELRTAAFQLALISGASTLLFNLNPLVRLDGYFIFTDLAGTPNLGTRAAMSSRTVSSWMMGAPWRAISWPHLAYSIGAYFYRWVIFAGVFWLAYSVDPRLAGPVAIIALSLLVVRPLITSARAGLNAGAEGSRLRGLTTLGFTAGLAAAAILIPVADWTVADGRVERFEERPVFATTTAQIISVAAPQVGGTALELSDPTLPAEETEAALSLQRSDISIRRAAATHPEIAAELKEERKAIEARLDRLAARRSELTIEVPKDARWRPLAAEHLEAAWVAPSGRPLGVIAEPKSATVVAQLPQADRSGLTMMPGDPVHIIAWHDPDCAFEAPVGKMARAAAADAFEIEADMAALAGCAARLPHGAAVRLRIDRAPVPVALQLWRAALRLAQSRLPIALNS